MDFRGFDSSTVLILRGGIPRPTGNFPESLSQAILVGVMAVGGLGVTAGHAEKSVDLDDISGGCVIYVCVYIYIYIYIERERCIERERGSDSYHSRSYHVML